MNRQNPPGAIEWTRIKDADGTVRPGYTWNPLKGCEHACEWTMPDGNVAVCYAKTVAERVAQASYPQGFAHHYWDPKLLKEPLKVKVPAGIFAGSMTDFMGHWVTDAEIEAVLDIMRQASHHIFQILTKNPRRLLKFTFPSNVWVGASMPPDSMYGKPLSQSQKGRMLRITLETLAQVKTPVRWLSAEPLSWNIAPLMEGFPGAIQWCVIGAASNGKTLYAPEDGHVQALVEVLEDQRAATFYKGNMRASAWGAANWRDEFPVVKPKPTTEQVFEALDNYIARTDAKLREVETRPLTTKEMF
jgi:protein gp37